MSYAVNTIVDYIGNSELCLGIVTKEQQDRIQVRGATNQVVKIPFKQVICDYGECTANNPLPKLVEIQNLITEELSGIELELLYDAMRENSELTTLPAIAAEYFGAGYTNVQLSALGRALVNDALRFQRNGVEFAPRTPEEIAKLEELRRHRAAKAAWREAVRVWLLKVIAAPAEQCLQAPIEVPEEMEDFVHQTTLYLTDGQNCEAVNLLATAPTKLTPRELALSVLKKTNRLPEDADEFLLSNGIHAGFPSNVLEFTGELAPYTSGSREKLQLPLVFSIDDEWTREIDDALSVTTNDDGTWTVGIHLANPSTFVSKNDLLDQAAIERPLSLYLPTTTVTMFPPRLGCDLASLSAEQLRPAMSFMVQLNDEGDIVDWRIAASEIQVTDRLTYIKADQLLRECGDGSDSQSPIVSALRILDNLATKRRVFREECGAVSLNRPEIKIRVIKDEIFAEREDVDTPSRMLVQEFMILANHLAAKYALRNDIPIIYRCQEQPYDDVHSVIHYDPIDFDRQVRQMKRTRLSTYPEGHFGLGLDLYTQVSSPLRRYADLVIQRQICAHLADEPLPYTQQELFGVLDNVERTAGANRALEREAHKYWMLEYLRRNYLEKTLTATVVRVDGSLVLAELNDFFERGVVITRDRPAVGEILKVRIAEINPRQGRLAMEIKY